MILATALLLAAAQPAERTYTGPAVVCGEAFALRLVRGERATSRSPVEDFVLHRIEGLDGLVVLYEGNAPQPHDDEIRPGSGWPEVIAIHDNRSAAAKARSRFRDRLLVGPARAALCPRR
jgi:hypothetical protein